MNAIFDPDHFFDTIYCISIEARRDRRDAAAAAFEKLGILARVEFVLVQLHPTNREEGIFESHMQCIHQGLEAGAQHILIFEDDLLIKNFKAEKIIDAIGFLQKNDGWDAFFLGAISRGSKKTVSRSVNKIEYRCLAHAYALNRQFAASLVTESWVNIPFDDVLRQKCEKSYALSPMIAFQSTASSDNSTVFLDRLRRVFGGFPFVQRCNELFQRYKIPVLCLHLLVFCVAILLFIQR